MTRGPEFNPAALPSEYMKKFVREQEPIEAGAKTHFLYPGHIYAANEPTIISTILGSCAAVCLWDKRLRIGGMNHYLLAEGSDVGANRFRYGCNANPALLQQLVALGSDIKNLQGKLFGGASSFSACPEESLGTRNIELAESFLRSAGIPIVLKDVSGSRGRRLFFSTHDGLTSLKTFEKG